jgi:hypothetical protein
MYIYSCKAQSILRTSSHDEKFISSHQATVSTSVCKSSLPGVIRHSDHDWNRFAKKLSSEANQTLMTLLWPQVLQYPAGNNTSIGKDLLVFPLQKGE